MRYLKHINESDYENNNCDDLMDLFQGLEDDFNVGIKIEKYKHNPHEYNINISFYDKIHDDFPNDLIKYLDRAESHNTTFIGARIFKKNESDYVGQLYESWGKDFFAKKLSQKIWRDATHVNILLFHGRENQQS